MNWRLALLLVLWPVLAMAQSDFSTRNPVGLFQDLQADTVTTDLFNHFAPTPHVSFHVTVPVPGEDLTGATGALAALDFNNDGVLDVVKGDAAFPGERPSLLLMGKGDGTFAIVPTEALPPQVGLITAADLDNDGWTDLVLTEHVGGLRHQTWESNVLDEVKGPWLRVLLNRGGQGFEDVTQAWLGSRELFTPYYLLADLDQDGWLDLILNDMADENTRRVIISRGQAGGFDRQAAKPIDIYGPEFGLTPNAPRLPHFSALDVDEDGDQDLLVMEGSRWSNWEQRLLVMKNEGGRLQAAQVVPLQLGGNTALNWADVNNDGLLDAFGGVQDFAGGRNQLHLNLGDGRFQDRGREMGLWAGYNVTPAVQWADWDNDGWLDLVQCRSFSEGAYTEPALFLNDGGQRFLNITGTADALLGPGVQCALALDADQDGDQDLLLSHTLLYLDRLPLERTGMKLLRNDSQCGHWLNVRLEGTVSNRSALGGRVTVHAGGRSFHQQVANGAVQGAVWPSLAMHFGLGDAAAVDSISVRWPTGEWEHWSEVRADQAVVLSEGEGESRSGR